LHQGLVVQKLKKYSMKRFLLLSVLLACIVTVGNSQPALEYATVGFSGYYDLSKWTKVPNSGSIDVSGAPSSVIFISGDSGSADTTYMTIVVPADGEISFLWNYSTVDEGAQFDYPVYILNGEMFMFPGYVIPEDEEEGDGPLTAPEEGDDEGFGVEPQSGQFTIHVEKGQTFAIGAYTVDGIIGSCTINAFNFNVTSVPFALPAVLGIFGLAGIGAVVRFRRRKK
jgi:hypothetical protein